MKLSNYKRANRLTVKKWLVDELNLTPIQSEKLSDYYANGILDNCRYEFFEWQPQKSKNLLWRLTAIIVIPYMIIMLLGMPIKYLITGNSYYGRKTMDFHRKWMKNCGLNHFV
jgi:hypothetical protein